MWNNDFDTHIEHEMYGNVCHGTSTQSGRYKCASENEDVSKDLSRAREMMT